MRTITMAGLAAMCVVGCGPGGSAAPGTKGGSSGSSAMSLETGTTISATTNRTISSKTDKAGATFTAAVSSDVKDSKGDVVIPAGSEIEMKITEIQPSPDKSTDGRLVVVVNSATIGGENYPLDAEITSMSHSLKGQGVGAGEVEKTAAGAVIGGIAGRVVGGNSKGTVIGAVAGGAVGAAVASQSADRDVVVAAGTPIVIKLDAPLSVKH